MPSFQSIHLAAPARVAEVVGAVYRLGPLPDMRRPLAVGEKIENDRVLLDRGARLILQVEGGERLMLDVGAPQGRTYFFHVVDTERIRISIAMK